MMLLLMMRPQLRQPLQPLLPLLQKLPLWLLKQRRLQLPCCQLEQLH